MDCSPRDTLGLLLRDTEGRAADRLINVAITRAKSKFLIVANVRGMTAIYPQRGLLLRALLDKLCDSDAHISGSETLALLAEGSDGASRHFYTSGSDSDAWEAFINDVEGARRNVLLLMSRKLTGSTKQINRLSSAIESAARRGASIEILGTAARELPPNVLSYSKEAKGLPNTALALVDDYILWNGLPCSWLKDHNGVRLSYDPVFRIAGGHAAKEVSRIYRNRIKRILEQSVANQSSQSTGYQLSLNLDF